MKAMIQVREEDVRVCLWKIMPIMDIWFRAKQVYPSLSHCCPVVIQ